MRTLTPFVLLGLALGYTTDAGACGCFTPPDPSVPDRAGGRAHRVRHERRQVTAHIQIQYQGTAADFGWLLPLPSVPTLELGTDELFTQLIATTQPQYKVNRVYEGNCSFDPSRGGGIGVRRHTDGERRRRRRRRPAAATPARRWSIQDSIGPYDYAVLKADTKDAMLQWLADNHYFVPTGTDDAVGPYIHPGAYFLALKLKSGNDVGDLQPVVVNYASDLPMIPLVLTSVGGQPAHGHPGVDARRRPRHSAQLLSHGHQRREARLAQRLAELQRRHHRRDRGGAGQALVRDRVRGRA